MACSLLAGGETVLENYTPCEDSEHAVEAFQRLGGRVSRSADRLRLIFEGVRGGEHLLDFGGSATSMRLFLGVSCVTEGVKILTGSHQLLSRPIHPLVVALRSLGAKIEYLRDSAPPVIVYPSKIKGGDAWVDGSLSSQFVSSMMLAGCSASSELTVNVSGKMVSKGYVDITKRVLETMGGKAEVDFDKGQVRVFPMQLRPSSIRLEGDYSGAAYLLVAGALTGEVNVGNLNPESLQPDKAVLNLLGVAECDVHASGNHVSAAKSAPSPFGFNLEDNPDLGPLAAVFAAFCHGESELTSIGRLRHKETDRVQSTLEMLNSLGVRAETRGDTMIIHGTGKVRGGSVDAMGDHRIAMSAAVAGLASVEGVTVSGFECSGKSYPGFLSDVAQLGGVVEV